MSSYSIELPLDDDGFIRRECPACRTEFKWHYGPTDLTPDSFVDPSSYWCPICGRPADSNAWFTTAQVDYMQKIGVRGFANELDQEMKRSSNSPSSGFLKIELNASFRTPPSALIEPNDMAILESPCHPWEPVKVPEQLSPPFYCSICGAPYDISD